MTAVSFSVPFVKTDGVDVLLLRLVIQSTSLQCLSKRPVRGRMLAKQLLDLYVLSTSRVGFNCSTAGETWVEK
jgi:hypothetical protein